MTQEASQQELKARAAQRDRHQKTGHPGVTFRETAEGRSYYVYDGGERKHKRSPYVRAGRTLKEALALQAEIRGRKARGERVVLNSKRTVREVAEEWFTAEQSRWREEYRAEQRRMLDKRVLKEFGDDRVASIGPREILAYDKKLRAGGLSASGAANVMKPLRGTLDQAVLAGDIPVNPFSLIPKGKLSSCVARREHHTWTTEEVDRFIATAHEHDTRKEAQRSYGDQIELMIRCGLRIGEASGLRCSDVDHDAKVIRVRRQWTKLNRVAEYTKTAAGRREIPVTQELLDRLAFRQSFYGLGEGDFVFVEEPGAAPTSHSNFRRRAWNPVVEKSGLKLEPGVKVTSHDARHATASQLASLGLDEEDGAALLGHTSGRVTRGIYVHAFDKEKREARIRALMEQAQGSTS